MRINDAGFNLIKQFEGRKLTAYQDIVGVWTFGYGHTGYEAYMGNVIDQMTADKLLHDDIGKVEAGIEKRLKVKVSENQFSAMCSLTYNIGLGAFSASTLLKLVNSGDFKSAADQFLRWNKAGDQVVKGLSRRREAERSLYLA